MIPVAFALKLPFSVSGEDCSSMIRASSLVGAITFNIDSFVSLSFFVFEQFDNRTTRIEMLIRVFIGLIFRFVIEKGLLF